MSIISCIDEELNDFAYILIAAQAEELMKERDKLALLFEAHQKQLSELSREFSDGGFEQALNELSQPAAAEEPHMKNQNY